MQKPLDAFKRQATLLKRATGCTHAEALEKIAKHRGYESYRQAKATLDAGSRV